MQKTMLMVLRGDIQMGESDPLVDSLKKEFPNPKTGSLCIIGDLLELALREGHCFSCIAFAALMTLLLT